MDKMLIGLIILALLGGLLVGGAPILAEKAERRMVYGKCLKSGNKTYAVGMLAYLVTAAMTMIFVLIAIAVDVFFLKSVFALGYIVLELVVLPLPIFIFMSVLECYIRYYRKLTIENQTLRLQGLWREKVIPFEELQKGRRLAKPFLYQNRLYFKLEQGSIFIEPAGYIGGIAFVDALFAELGWEAADLHKEQLLPSATEKGQKTRGDSREEKALYEMLEKEQRQLMEQRKQWKRKQRKLKKKEREKQEEPCGLWKARSLYD